MAISHEWAHLYSRPDVYGLEFLHANFVRHRYPRHVHDFYVVGIIEAGRQTFSCGTLSLPDQTQDEVRRNLGVLIFSAFYVLVQLGQQLRKFALLVRMIL